MLKFMCLLSCVVHGLALHYADDRPFPQLFYMDEELFSIRVPKNAKLMVKSDDDFDCEGKRFGFYPDVRSECKVIHVCHPSLSFDGLFSKFSFFCGGDTAFDERTQSCTQIDIQFPCFGSPSFFEFQSEFSKRLAGAMNPVSNAFKKLFYPPFSNRRVYTTPAPPVETLTSGPVSPKPTGTYSSGWLDLPTLATKFPFPGVVISMFGNRKPTESSVNRRVDVTTSSPVEEEGSGMGSEPLVSVTEDEEGVDVTTVAPWLMFPTEMPGDAGVEVEAGGDNYYRGELGTSDESTKGAGFYSAIGDDVKKHYSKREIRMTGDEEQMMVEEMMHAAEKVPVDAGEGQMLGAEHNMEKVDEGKMMLSGTEMPSKAGEEEMTGEDIIYSARELFTNAGNEQMMGAEEKEEMMFPRTEMPENAGEELTIGEETMSSAKEMPVNAGEEKMMLEEAMLSTKEMPINTGEEMMIGGEGSMDINENEEMMPSSTEMPIITGEEQRKGEVTKAFTEEMPINAGEEQLVKAREEIEMDPREKAMEGTMIKKTMVMDTEKMVNPSLEKESQISEDALQISEEKKTVQTPLANDREKRSLLFDIDVEETTEQDVSVETTTPMPNDDDVHAMSIQPDKLMHSLLQALGKIEKFSRMDDNSEEDDLYESEEDLFTTPVSI